MTMQHIGGQVAYWRQRRGKSQRVLAGLAGISQPYLSQIETGTRPVEKRRTLVALAEALQVSVAELTGQPGDPLDPSRAKAAAYVPDIREALIMRETGEQTEPVGDVGQALTARAAYDFAAAAPTLPGLLASVTGPDLIKVGAVAISVLRHLGYVDLAREAARLCVTAGQDSGDPAWLGVGERLRVHCLPPESKAGPGFAARAADGIEQHLGDPRVRRAYGMLHLEAALRSAALKQPGEAMAHLGEAQQTAASVGEPDDWHDLAQSCFGPSNVAMWKVAVMSELGDQDEALHAAAVATLERVPFRHRQASFLIEHMTILATAGRDDEATAAFLRAESLAPQYVRLRPVAKDTITVLVRRAQRRAVNTKLRRAASMVGLRIDR